MRSGSATGKPGDPVGQTHRALARATVWRIAARAAGSLMLGAFLLLLAGQLSVTAFGQLILVYSLGMVVGTVAGLGAPTQALRATAVDDSAGSAASLFVIHTVVVGGTALIAIGLLGMAGAPAVCAAGACFAASDTLTNYAQSHLAGQGAHWQASALLVVQRAAPLIVVAIPRSGTAGTVHLLIAVFLATATLAVLAPLATVRVRALRDLRWTGSRPGLGYWMLSMSGTLAQLQVPAIALVAGSQTVGYLALATRVTGPLTLLSAAAATVLIPELARRTGDAAGFGALYRRYRHWTTGYCALLVVLAWPISLLVVELAGGKYRPAQAMVAGLTVAAGLSCVSQAVCAKRVARGAPGRAAAAITAGGCLTLIGLVVLGAAGATALLGAAPVLGQLAVLALLTVPITRRRARPPAVSWQSTLVGAAAVVSAVTVAAAALSADTGSRVAGHSSTPAPLPEPAAIRILVIGDSVTEGTRFGGRGDANWTRIDQAALIARSSGRCRVLLRVSGRGGSGYVTTGVRGTTFGSEVRRLATPDLAAIVFVGGGNDADQLGEDYRQQVTETLAAARRASPGAQLAVVTPSWIRGGAIPATYRAFAEYLAEAAAASGSRFVDSNAAGWFRGAPAATVLGGDGQHPTDAGHRILARNMLPVLTDLARSGRCR